MAEHFVLFEEPFKLTSPHLSLVPRISFLDVSLHHSNLLLHQLFV